MPIVLSPVAFQNFSVTHCQGRPTPQWITTRLDGRFAPYLNLETFKLAYRRKKFTPANVQKIKDFVAQGLSREGIAKSLDVTVGSLQVTCSRLGISLRGHDRAARVRVSSRAFVANGQLYVGHIRREADRRARFQVVLQSQGKELATDLAITARDIGRLGLEASTQGLAMTELMSQVLAEALKKHLIQEILGADVPRSQP